MVHWLYNTAIFCYGALIRVAANFNPKARLFIQGRKNQWERLSLIPKNKPVIWFHAASLGEFEQGKPVMELLLARHTDKQLVVTFFSPSGYEVQKNYAHASVFYLPIDTPRKAKRFVKTVNPVLAVFVRYEFWANYFLALREAKIPTAVIAAQFRPKQFLFSFWGRWILKQVKQLDTITVQYQSAKEVLLQHGFDTQKIHVCGDSRFDRALLTVARAEEIDAIKNFKGDKRLLVLGSGYAEEIKFILPELERMSGWKILLAPHLVDPTSVANLVALLPSAPTYFRDASININVHVLVLNTIGKLAAAYKYADLAIVGGGFGKGIHNIIEPAAFGVPLFFGPKHDKFPEAAAFIKAGFATDISGKNAKNQLQDFLQKPEDIDRLSPQITDFVTSHAGAAQCIAANLEKLIN